MWTALRPTPRDSRGGVLAAWRGRRRATESAPPEMAMQRRSPGRICSREKGSADISSSSYRSLGFGLPTSELSEHLERDDGCVVVQSAAVGEGSYILEKALCGGFGLQEVFFEAVLAVLLLVGADGFGDAVAVEDKARTGC